MSLVQFHVKRARTRTEVARPDEWNVGRVRSRLSGRSPRMSSNAAPREEFLSIGASTSRTPINRCLLRAQRGLPQIIHAGDE